MTGENSLKSAKFVTLKTNVTTGKVFGVWHMITGDSLLVAIRVYLIKMFAGSKDYTREAHDKFYKEIMKQINNIMTYMVEIGVNVNDGNINKMKYRMLDAITNRLNREIEKHQASDITQFMELQFDDIIRHTLENMYVHE